MSHFGGSLLKVPCVGDEHYIFLNLHELDVESWKLFCAMRSTRIPVVSIFHYFTNAEYNLSDIFTGSWHLSQMHCQRVLQKENHSINIFY